MLTLDTADGIRHRKARRSRKEYQWVMLKSMDDPAAGVAGTILPMAGDQGYAVLRSGEIGTSVVMIAIDVAMDKPEEGTCVFPL